MALDRALKWPPGGGWMDSRDHLTPTSHTVYRVCVRVGKCVPVVFSERQPVRNRLSASAIEREQRSTPNALGNGESAGARARALVCVWQLPEGLYT